MFAIIESGRRVSLPIDRLLQSEPGVQPITAPSRVARVGDEASAARPLDAYGTQAPVRERRRLRVAGDVMATPVHTLRPDDPVAAAWQLLLTRRFHHVPLVNSRGELEGIVSDRDLLRAAVRERASVDDWPLMRLLQPRVIVAAPETPLRSLAEVMAARQIGAIPIVDPQTRPVGMVSRADLLRALVGEAPLDVWS